jgi:NADH-quinone oxidoreductase subunit G
MPHIEIDGRPVEVAAGTNVIEAAKKLNIEVPHYCYHAGLTVVGSCRMCQVEIEQNGRKSIVVGCNTPAADGMKVTTLGETVHKLRSSVLEFYLQHHPLDCPICDDAGECDLQNYYMKYGLHDSRVDLVEKAHKHKVHDVGPTVVLDSERCVLCSRCVRFCREVAGADELGIFGSGGHAELMNVPGKRLENDYAGNVVDLCPVGALTDKDFRFKRRVWYLKRTTSICHGCSRGCNVYVDHETDRAYKDPQRRIQRLKPRYHRLVNEWWLCDRGRYSYHHVDSADRILAPATKSESNGHSVTMDEVIHRAATRIEAAVKQQGPGSVGIIGSARSSNEDLFLLKRFTDHLKLTNFDVTLASEPKGKEDEILMKADLTPNRRGAREIGVWVQEGGANGDEILEAAKEGEFEVLIVVNHDLSKQLSAREQKRLDEHCGYILYLTTHDSGTAPLADDILPIAMWAEREATYTNFQGRVQRTSKSFDPRGMAVPEWTIWQQLGAQLGLTASFQNPCDVFDAIGNSVAHFKGLTWEGLGDSGKMLTGVPEPAYKKIQSAHPLAAY